MTGYVGCHGSQEKTLAPESYAVLDASEKQNVMGTENYGSLKMKAISNSDGINLHGGA